MVKICKNYFYLFIIPICLAIGIVRKIQLDNLERLKFGHVHGAGSCTLLGFISTGLYLTVVFMIFRQLHDSRYKKVVKIKVGMFIGVVSAGALFVFVHLIR